MALPFFPQTLSTKKKHTHTPKQNNNTGQVTDRKQYNTGERDAKIMFTYWIS